MTDFELRNQAIVAERLLDGRTQAFLSRKYGISQPRVADIVAGWKWQHRYADNRLLRWLDAGWLVEV